MCSTGNTKAKYAILGDDFVIESQYGDRYLEIIKSLGVDISLGKSIINSNFIEFAKRLFNSITGEVDVILGPKLVIQAIQNNFFKITLIHECYKRDYISKLTLFEKLGNPS